MSNNRWYVKTAYPDESIVAVFNTEKEATAWADERNGYIQANKYYAEEHDPAKVWDVDIIEFIMKYQEGKEK
jgi:hypothetical protein